MGWGLCRGVSGQGPENRFKVGSGSRGEICGPDSNELGQEIKEHSGVFLPAPPFLADQALVPPRGLELPPRGWSVSLHSGDSWQDLAGCDFVLDLIGQTEDPGDPISPHSYPIAPHGL